GRATRRPAAPRPGGPQRTGPTPVQGNLARGGRARSFVDIAYSRGKRVEQLLHARRSVGRHDEYAPVRVHHHEVVSTEQYDRISVGPDDAVSGFMEERRSDHHVPSPILRPNPSHPGP